eukprot:INCI3005.1.p1 GENE.INCI3005.1~~INCI3005.1.p1  ORF type:complete len:287 (-),score=49.28 INCI3005.1:50-910(-)
MSTEWSRGSTTGLNLKKKDTTRRHKLHRERINAIYDVDRTTQFQENPPRVWESRYQSGLDSTAGRIMRPAREEGSLSAVDRNRQKTIRKANKFLADRVKAVKCRTFKKRVPLLPGLQMDKFQAPCIDNQEPERSTEDLAQTLFNNRMKIQRQIQRENAKLISCIVQKESFYNEREMSAHEEAFMKYRKLRSGQGRQTEMYLGRQKNRKTRKKKKPPRSFKDSLKASYALAKEPTARLKFRDNWAKEPTPEFQPLVSEQELESGVLVEDEAFAYSNATHDLEGDSTL